MRMIKTDSSNLNSIGYDPDNHTLRVVFNSGIVYNYFDVAPGLVTQVLFAESQGSAFNSFVKNDKTIRYEKEDNG